MTLLTSRAPDADLATAGAPTDSDAQLGSSIGKALALLVAFMPDGAPRGVSELARRAGVPKSTAHRLLAVLGLFGFVERWDERYVLGKRMFELGNLVGPLRSRDLREVALPFMQDLYELTHGTVHLAVLDGCDVLYVEKIYGHDAARSPSKVGGRVPANATAVGKALLAFSSDEVVDRVTADGLPRLTQYTIVTPGLFRDELRQIREDGVAYDREEARIGLTCVAAPILDRHAQPAGAISVSGAVGCLRTESLALSVRRAALGIGRRLSASSARRAGGA